MISLSGWKLKAAAALSTLALVITTVVYAATPVDIKFVNHIQANLPEQDVFVESKDNPNQVVRVEGDIAKDPTTLAKKAYAAVSAVPHDPFKVGPNPLGPYPKGKTLGFTLEEWLAAKATGTYTVDGDTATLDLTFEGLVPKGVYTVWCSRLTFPPNPAVVDKPCGAEDGSKNVFTAFGNGAGEFKLTMKPLEESTKETASVIALAYHSDGKTYGATPGDFGLNSHVQLFFLVPAAQAAMESVSPTATPVATQAGGLSKNAWLAIIVGIGVIGVAAWWWYSKKSSDGPTTPGV